MHCNSSSRHARNRTLLKSLRGPGIPVKCLQRTSIKKRNLVQLQCEFRHNQFKHFALAFIHSHHGATGIFPNGFYGNCRIGDFLFTKNTADDIGSFTVVCDVGVLEAIPCEYRQTFCVGLVRYCYLFHVVYFLIITLKNCKTKRIFVSNKNVLPGADAIGPVDRHGTCLALWGRPGTKSTN